MNPTQMMKELIPNKHGKLHHIRTGRVAKHFEIKGVSKRGGPMSVILVAQPAVIRAFLETPLLAGVRRVRFEDGTSMWVEQVGDQAKINALLARTENLDAENTGHLIMEDDDGQS